MPGGSLKLMRDDKSIKVLTKFPPSAEINAIFLKKVVIMIKKIDHIGVAVKSIDDAVPYYENALGLKCEGVEEVADQKVKTAFFSVGGVHIELLEPTSPDSPIAKFLEKNPHGGVHHVAFNSDDIVADLAHAKAAGVGLINEEPKIGAHAKKIAFLHPKFTKGVLTEFCQDGDCSCK